MNKKFLLLCFISLSMMAFAQKKKRINIVAGAGHAWRIGKLDLLNSENRKNHFKKLQTGFTQNVGVYYSVLPNFGVGLKYYHFEVDKHSQFWAFSPAYNRLLLIDIYTKDRMDYYGVGGIFSNFDKETTRHKFYIDGTAGIMKFKSKNYMTYNGDRDIMVTNFALAGNLGYMYEFSPNILVGPQVSATAGIVKEAEIGGVKFEHKASLFSISANIGATIRF